MDQRTFGRIAASLALAALPSRPARAVEAVATPAASLAPPGATPSPAPPAAEQPAPTAASESGALHHVTASLSLVSAWFAVVEGRVEIRASKRFGVLVLAGAGTVTLSDNPDPLWPGKVAVQEFGGQLRLYPIGNYDTGLVVGAEALYMRVSVREDEGLLYRASASGLGVGPFVGGKLTLAFGATALAQVGLLAMPVKGHVESLDGTRSANVKSSIVTPLADLGVGWSF
jgi:hypothetical protein